MSILLKNQKTTYLEQEVKVAIDKLKELQGFFKEDLKSAGYSRRSDGYLENVHLYKRLYNSLIEHLENALWDPFRHVDVKEPIKDEP